MFLTRAEPASIGLSSIGARLQPVSSADEGGLYYCLAGTEGQSLGGEVVKVLAPIAPGVIPEVSVSSWRRLADGEKVMVPRRHCTVALDGERAFSVSPEQQLEVAVRRDGPRVVQLEAALHEAASLGLFRA